MKSALAVLVAAALAAAMAWLLKPDSSSIVSGPPSLSTQTIGVLASLRVRYSNVIEFNENVQTGIPGTALQIPLGGARALLVARGDCQLGTDLTRATYEGVDVARRRATLVLPQVAVLSARLSHDPKDGSYLYDSGAKGAVRLIPGSDLERKAVNRVMEIGQKDIETQCAGEAFAAAARASAETVLAPILSASGWTITIAWR